MARHHRLLGASSRHLLNSSLATLPLSAIALALRGVPISLAVAGAIAAPSAYAADGAQAAPARKAYSVPAGSLGAALSEFASQAGVTVQIDSRLVEGLKTQGVRGNFTVYEGFTTLLQGTKLEIAESNPGVYLVRARPASSASTGEAALPAEKVHSTTDSEVARVNPPTTVASKVPLTQQEIPQSVSVITQDQIQEQAIKNLDQALRYAPGIDVFASDGQRFQYYARGFPISNFEIDGAPVYVNPNLSDTSTTNSPTMAMYDRVEILRGPAGLYDGFGGPGGTIALVRKRPQNEFTASADIDGGTYGNAGAQVDVGGPLNSAGTVRGRIVGAYQDQDLTADSTWKRDRQIYGTLEGGHWPSDIPGADRDVIFHR